MASQINNEVIVISSRSQFNGSVYLYAFLFFSFFCFIQLRGVFGGSLLILYLFALFSFLATNFEILIRAFLGIREKISVLLFFFIWSVLSVIWSDSPGASVACLVYFVLVFLSGLAITELLSEIQIYKIIKRFVYFVLFLDVLVVIFVPSIGFMSGISGLHYEKNQFGTIMAISAMVLFILPDRKFLDWFGFFVATALLYLSESKTAFFLVAFLVAVKVLNGLRVRINCDKFVNPVFVSIIIVLGSFFVFPEIADYVQYELDPDFMTGRGQIWKITTAYVDNKTLGNGYGAFWGLGYQAAFADQFFLPSTEWMQIIEQGHNGYLDMYATLGTVGLCIFLFVLVIHVRNAIKSSSFYGRELSVAFLVFVIIHNLSETSFLYYASPLWCIFFINYFIIEKNQNES